MKTVIESGINSAKPEFFIIGAPKAGTSSIRKYLLENFRIYMPSPVEPNFFCSDLNPYEYAKGEEWYLHKYFDVRSSDFDLIGEKSTWYLYSRAAIQNLLSFKPSAKMIVFIRNPIDLAYAFHQEMVFCRMESIDSFETAWKLQDSRQFHHQDQNNIRFSSELLHYGQVASIGTQLERVTDQVPSDQLFVGFLDDIRLEPERLIQGLCRFLSLPTDVSNEIPVENESKEIRNSFLDHFLVPPRALVDGVERFKELAGMRSLGLGRLMRAIRMSVNTKVVARDPLARPLKEELIEYFEPEVMKLEKLTGRDLAHYLSI